MSQPELGSQKHNVTHYRQVVYNGNVSHAEIDIPGGTEIWNATRLAAKIAITENVEVRFSFNDRPQSVTVDQAKDLLNPEEIRKEIERHKASIERFKDGILKTEQLVKDEEQLGILLYGKEFLDSSEK